MHSANLPRVGYDNIPRPIVLLLIPGSLCNYDSQPEKERDQPHKDSSVKSQDSRPPQCTRLPRGRDRETLLQAYILSNGKRTTINADVIETGCEIRVAVLRSEVCLVTQSDSLSVPRCRYLVSDQHEEGFVTRTPIASSPIIIAQVGYRRYGQRGGHFTDGFRTPPRSQQGLRSSLLGLC